MKQKIIFFFVIMMTALSQKEVMAYDYTAITTSGQRLYYNIVDGHAEVVCPTGNGYSSGYSAPTGNLVIPNTINYMGQDYNVTVIAKRAFIMCGYLLTVTIPNTVTRIEREAFYSCWQLCNVSIPNSVTTIEGRAFASTGLTSINIPCSVTHINDSVFLGCGALTSVTYSDSLESIGNYAFYGCGLSSITIGEMVTNIGAFAFSGCNNLTTITIGSAVSYIGRSAFYNCSNLTTTNYTGSISQWCNIDFSGEWENYGLSYANPLFWTHDLHINNEIITELVIPNGVTTIKSYAFIGCIGLNSVIIPNSVVNIGTGTFRGCSGITSLILPDSITHIGVYTFYNCRNLTSVTIPNQVTNIGDYAFYDCNNLYTVDFLSVNAPTIGNHTFYYNPENQKFNIPCGSYDSYYSSWIIHRPKLHEPEVEISFFLESDDTIKGTSNIVQQHGLDVACDSSVIIRADGNYGYHFDHWSNGRTANPDTLFLSGDSSVTAFFSPNQYTLTLFSSDEAHGSVSGGGAFNYLDTALIEATVTADHYHFVRWYDDNTDNPRQYVITGDDTLWAYFSIDKFTVTAVPNNSERGSVNGGREYSYGTVCTLTAGAFSGYQFAKWSDGTTSNPYIFAVSEDVDLRALFVTEGEQIFSINASSADPAMGKVYGGGYAVNGDEVTLRAVSHPGYYFLHWSDNETDSTRTIEVHGNLTLTAHFAPNVGIADIIKNKVRIFSRDRQIIVEGSEGMRIWVFDMMGRIIYNGKTPIIPIQQTGVYIVKVGNNPARKVVVMR